MIPVGYSQNLSFVDADRYHEFQKPRHILTRWRRHLALHYWKTSAHWNPAWSLNTLTFKPAQQQDRVALTSALQHADGVNLRLRDDLKAVEAQF